MLVSWSKGHEDTKKKKKNGESWKGGTEKEVSKRPMAGVSAMYPRSDRGVSSGRKDLEKRRGVEVFIRTGQILRASNQRGGKRNIGKGKKGRAFQREGGETQNRGGEGRAISHAGREVLL